MYSYFGRVGLLEVQGCVPCNSSTTISIKFDPTQSVVYNSNMQYTCPKIFVSDFNIINLSVAVREHALFFYINEHALYQLT